MNKKDYFQDSRDSIFISTIPHVLKTWRHIKRTELEETNK